MLKLRNRVWSAAAAAMKKYPRHLGILLESAQSVDQADPNLPVDT